MLSISVQVLIYYFKNYLNWNSYYEVYFLIEGWLLYNIYGFAIQQHESAIGIHIPPPLEPPYHLPPHPTPESCHRAPDLSSLCHTANFHSLSILYMVKFLFQCCPPNSSHPILSQLCPQVCFLCLCLHCCSANRLVSTILLDSIYIH